MSDEQIQSLPSDPFEALAQVHSVWMNWKPGAAVKQNPQDLTPEAYDGFLFWLALVKQLVEQAPEHKQLADVPPKLGVNRHANANNVINMMDSVAKLAEAHLTFRDATARVASHGDRIAALLDGRIVYEFREDQFETVKDLLNRLKNAIEGLEGISESHRARLLRRWAKLMSELHRRMDTLETIAWFMWEIRAVVKDVGPAASELRELVKEVRNVLAAVVLAVWGVNALPPGSNDLADSMFNPLGHEPKLLEGQAQSVLEGGVGGAETPEIDGTR